MKITDKAVEAAMRVHGKCCVMDELRREQYITKVLEAALPHMYTSLKKEQEFTEYLAMRLEEYKKLLFAKYQIKIKKLLWSSSGFTYRVDRYEIEDMGSNWLQDRYQLYIDKIRVGVFRTLEQAKAAAQEDFERRIRWSLEE